jgi:hypothetical protein
VLSTCRGGSITQLCSTHRSIRGLDACRRSGHVTGTSIDSYPEKTFIASRGLCGGKALVGFMDVNANIKVPRLECLGVHTEVAVCGFSSIVLTKRVPTCCASDLHSSIIDHISTNGHTRAWERKCCHHKAVQFCKKCPYYGYLLPKQKSGVSFR